MSAPKTVRVRVHEILGPHPVDLEIPLRELNDDHDRLFADIRSHPARGRMLQDLTCQHRRPDPIWLVVAALGPLRWSLRHWPCSGLGGGHKVRGRRAGMSDEHKRQEDYAQRCANDHPRGRGVLEKSLARGTISDVAMYVDDTPVATSEIQLAAEHISDIRRRDTAVVNKGIDPLWFGHTDSRPNWAAEVAWLGANRLEHMRPGGWTVASGHRAIDRWERCGPGADMPCPFQPAGRWCRGVHPVWAPRGGPVDDLIARVLDRDLRRVDVGGRVIVASPADVEAWADHHGDDPSVVAARLAKKARAVDLAAGKQVSHLVRDSAARGIDVPVEDPRQQDTPAAEQPAGAAPPLALFPLGTVDPTTCQWRGCRATRERGYALCRYHRLDVQHPA